VLREVSRVLRELHEEKQIVCRYGGEEFCVMLPGMDVNEALIQAECTRLAIAEIRLADPASLRLTASLGVSDTSFGANETQELINQADACLYVAKRAGRNQSVTYDPARIEAMGTEVEEATDQHVDPNLVSLPFHAVTALVSALANRSPETAEHSRRVADLCVTLAKDMMCQREIYVLETAALLHDIGKIGVPDQLLHKTEPLTTDDWKVIEHHNQIGLDMVAGTFHCAELESIIEHHHQNQSQRRNGESLTPNDATPLPARILAIADVYDTPVAGESKRHTNSKHDAVARLRDLAGTQLDAELVERFITCVVEKESENALGVPTTQGIAFAIPRPTAMQIGQQIEQLCDAMDSQDTDQLRSLTEELTRIAEANYLVPIVDAAAKIGSSIDRSEKEEIEWVEILRQTQTLLDLCRATQNFHLTEI
ncbi:MAG: diguanylate cyclase, partial [Planctomycetota bacterium]